jgi:PAS domain S-box-containing protein
MTEPASPILPTDNSDWTLETNLRCTHDLSGRFVSVSAGVVQALGYRKEDLLKLSVRDLIVSEYRDQFRTYLEKIQKENSANGFLALRTSSGVRRVWEYRNWVHSHKGSPIVVGTARDVTEHVQTKRLLRASEGRFATAFHSSPVAKAITTLAEGRYIDVNEAFERQMGYTRNEIIGRTSLELNVWPTPARRRAMINALQRHKTLLNQQAEFRTKSGALITTVYSAGLVTFEGKPCVLAGILDVTAQKAAENALRESEAKFRLLVETTRFGIFIYREDGTFCYFNPPVEVFTGYSADELQAMTVWDLVHPDLRDFIRARAQARLRGENVPSRSELKIIAKDGQTRWLDVTVQVIQYQGQPALLGTAFDITDREKAGFEVQRSLLLGQETERKRIARELHDDISQRLALVGLTLNEVETLSPSASPALSVKLKALRQHVNSLAHDIHRISHNLHPSTLVDLGLVSALRGLCREFSDQRRMAVRFTGEVVTARPSQEVAITLYRIAQEGLANVAMHSGSREARVALVERPDALHLTIADNGVGFDTARLRRRAGLGLVSIRERARLIGADVQITSFPEQGTKIQLRVPLTATTPAADEPSHGTAGLSTVVQ